MRKTESEGLKNVSIQLPPAVWSRVRLACKRRGIITQVWVAKILEHAVEAGEFEE